MRRFASPGEFAAFLATRAAAVAAAAAVGLEEAGKIIEAEAKQSIGTYQAAAGPFAEWAPLSDATLYGFHHPLAGWIEGRMEEYGDHPLLRDGTLREKITREVEAIGGGRVRLIVGVKHEMTSNDRGKPVDIGLVALWQEQGTPNAMYPIPPRPFLAGSLFRRQKEAINVVVSHVLLAISGSGE